MINEEHFNKFISFVFDPVTIEAKGCVGMACWGGVPQKGKVVKSTHGFTSGGWFNRATSLKLAAKSVEGVSCYVTFNPVHLDKMCEAANRLDRLGRGGGTQEKDILCYKYFVIDIDAERPNSKVSSTAAEHKLALDLRDRILDDRPEIRENCMFGSSGNGAYILARITDPLPNTAATKNKVKAILRGLAEKYGKKGRDAAFVDTNPFNPNAHVGLPGTFKRKGDSTEARPHRPVTVDGVATRPADRSV